MHYDLKGEKACHCNNPDGTSDFRESIIPREGSASLATTSKSNRLDGEPCLIAIPCELVDSTLHTLDR